MPSKVQLSNELYSCFRDLLQRRAGLYYPESRRADLAHGLEQALAFSGHTSLADLYADASSSGPGWDTLITHLTVGETRFFRNESQFDALRQHILPPLIAQRAQFRILRIWSAGCATGEEPYSLAILLTEMLPDIDQWNISILATDINPAFLSRAREALYSAWSFRDTPEALRTRYFHCEQSRWRLIPEIRRMVTFAQLNLAEANYPLLLNGTCALDIIVCRNVTIYFEPATTRQVVERFYAALSPGGWLLVGHAEPQASTYYQFETHNFPNTIFYRKPLDAPLFAVSTTSPASNLPSRTTGAGLPGAQIPDEHQTPKQAPEMRPPTAPTSYPDLRNALPGSHRSPTGSLLPATDAYADVPARQPAPPVPEHWSTIQEHLARGNKAAAEVLLCDLLQNEPGHVAALVALGRLYADRGDWLAAQQCCEQALERNPLSLEASFALAQIFEHERRLDEALASYRRTLYIDRSFVLGMLGMANVWRQMGRIPEAQRGYRNLLKHLATLPSSASVPWAEGSTVGEVARFAHRQLTTLTEG